MEVSGAEVSVSASAVGVAPAPAGGAVHLALSFGTGVENSGNLADYWGGLGGLHNSFFVFVVILSSVHSCPPAPLLGGGVSRGPLL